LDPNASPSAKLNANKEWNPSLRKSRRLEMKDFAPWVAAVERLDNVRMQHLFKLLLFTGIRLNEATQLTWTDVDLVAATLYVRDPKNRIPMVLPLNAQALAVMQEWQATVEDSQWVFPAVNRAGVIVPMGNPSKAIRWVVRASGVPWSPHDLRRTFISVGGSLQVNPIALRVLTNHARPAGDAHAGYHIPEMQELREVSQAIGDRMISALNRDNANPSACRSATEQL
jgi:integrase